MSQGYFLKAVFPKFYLVHSWIPWPKCEGTIATTFSSLSNCANFWECWDFLIFFSDIFALTFTKLVLISITVVRITNKKDYFNKHPIILRLNALNGVSTSLAKVRIPGTKIKKKSLHSKIFAHLLKLQNVC